MQTIRFEYFGYRVDFQTATNNVHDLRREANRIVLDSYGDNPFPSYVEPGVPFPDYVPAQVWEGDQGWQPY